MRSAQTQKSLSALLEETALLVSQGEMDTGRLKNRLKCYLLIAEVSVLELLDTCCGARAAAFHTFSMRMLFLQTFLVDRVCAPDICAFREVYVTCHVVIAFH